MPDIIKVFLPLILEMAERLADSVVDGSKLSDHEKRFLISGYTELSVWGKHFADDSANKYDDAAIEKALSWVVDTAEEAGLELPELPEFAPPAA